MNKYNRSHITLWSSLIASLVAFSPLIATEQDKVEETFSTTGSGQLSVHLPNGPIEIDTYDGSEVKIAITRTMKRGDTEDFRKELKKVDITFEQSGNDIDCTVKYERNNSGWSFFSGNKLNINFNTVVTLPRVYNVKARTSGGPINVKNLTGETDLTTSGGGINLKNVSGHSIAKTSGGSISATDCDGDFEMRTSGGNIKADHVEGEVVGRTSGGNIVIGDIDGDARVSTSGGSVTLGTVQGNLEATTSGGSIKAILGGQPSEVCELKTSGGSIVIAVNPKANLDIDASTSGGGVQSNLILSNTELKRSSLTGQLNGGGPMLKARTSGGSIHIHSI